MPTNDEMEKRAAAFDADHGCGSIGGCIHCMCEFARAEIERLDRQEDYLDSKIEAATETWKGVDTDDFMNELRQSDDDKTREEAMEAAWQAYLAVAWEARLPATALECGFDAGVAFAEPRNITTRDWIEDFVDDDNGDYCHVCPKCGEQFHGHKRRIGSVCKACWVKFATEIIIDQHDEFREFQKEVK